MKAVLICSLFDKHRDRELSAAERSEFDAHLAGCENCRAAISLLDNLVHLIKSEEVCPADMANRIAQNAFRRGNSWDFGVISWLRPGPALAALVLMLALFSSMWMISGDRQASAYSEYQKLIEEADEAKLGSSASDIRNNGIVIWLEQEGNSQ